MASLLGRGRSHITDEELDTAVQEAQEGHPEGYERIYRLLAPLVHGFFQGRGATEPEDLTQDVLAAVFEQLHKFHGREKFRSWVIGIAYRKLVDDCRRHGSHRVFPTDDLALLDGPGGDVNHDVATVLEARWVHHVSDQLTPSQRNVILLRVMWSLTNGEIAVIIGKNEDAVKKLAQRGFKAVRRILDREST